jgi:hypothetical protein
VARKLWFPCGTIDELASSRHHLIERYFSSLWIPYSGAGLNETDGKNYETSIDHLAHCLFGPELDGRQHARPR